MTVQMTISGLPEGRNRSMDLRKAVICLGIALLTVLVYWQIGQHEFISFDDNTYIFKNPHVTGGLTLGNVAWAFLRLRRWHKPIATDSLLRSMVRLSCCPRRA